MVVLATGCDDTTLTSICRGAQCDAPDAGVVQVVDAGPTEPCANLCGAICCGPGTLCRQGRCVPPCGSGVWCGRYSDDEVCCAEGEQCGNEGCFKPPDPLPSCDGGVWDSAFGTCLDEVVTGACEQPEPTTFEPEILWQFEAGDGFPNVMTTPLVVDVNGDGASDVLATFYSHEGGFGGTGLLRALSGVDGTELWKTPIDVPDSTLIPTAGIAVAALGEGKALTVLAVDAHSRLVAYDARSGDELWRSRTSEGGSAICDVGWGAPAVANIDLTGYPEIVCGFSVFEFNGVLRWSASSSASGPWGPIVAVGDLDGDGRLELTDGTRAYRHDGIPLWRNSESVPGLVAIADFLTSPQNLQLDGLPEVVVVRRGRLELLNGRTGSPLVYPALLPTWDGSCFGQNDVKGWGGPPAVADVTGDVTTDVVVASGECVGAFELRPNGASPEWKLMWGHSAVDETSSSTGPALFDFDGDLLPEVVYADERSLHILQGTLGVPLFSAPHCSGTLYESAVIADVDGDASANIVVASNVDTAATLGCSPDVPPGITVYRERWNRWANARAVWTQHGYSPAAACDGADEVCADWGEWNTPGRIPFELGARHQTPLNGARFNSHGKWTPLGIPNPAITHVVSDGTNCPREIVVRARVVNEGEAPLRAGTPVQLLVGGEVVAGSATLERILPGGSEAVELTWAPPRETQWPVAAQVRIGDLVGQTQCDTGDDALGLTIAACP